MQCANVVNDKRARIVLRTIKACELVVDLMHVQCALINSIIPRDHQLPDIPGIGDDMIARNPGTRFKVISDCGHWLQYEQPDLFHHELGEHLSLF